ncbi:MAG TPA: DsbA family protein [Gemmataceae bacterium]|jgi:protein-disulfide isomerase|nr:DsbA family protein [Gemmataceae bacterium]
MSHTPATRLTIPVGAHDHVQGSEKAAVTLLEYGDYECPYCGAALPVVKEVQQRLGAALRFVFRHFPLSMAHPHAQQAAEAAEAADTQGQFWEMHDLMFENQDALDDKNLAHFAKALGLDSAQFIGELTDHVHAARVRQDFMSGVRSGVNGTPTFFINGSRYVGSYDVESLLEAIETTEVDG